MTNDWAWNVNTFQQSESQKQQSQGGIKKNWVSHRSCYKHGFLLCHNYSYPSYSFTLVGKHQCIVYLCFCTCVLYILYLYVCILYLYLYLLSCIWVFATITLLLNIPSHRTAQPSVSRLSSRIKEERPLYYSLHQK